MTALETAGIKRVAILGSTGSIGQSALSLLKENHSQYQVELLVAGRNAKSLAEQIRFWRPPFAGVSDHTAVSELRAELGLQATDDRWEDTRLVTGEREICDAVSRCSADIVLAAIVGMAGLPSVLAAIEAGKDVALANKETLVVAGKLVMARAAARGVRILPVDSEHSAIFQAKVGVENHDVESVILTTSGGPFLHTPKEDFHTITPELALRHPKWNMGAKISIDSATMMNKSLEVIEAHWLFGVASEKIEVVVHPEHIIHSMVRLIDGSLLAQLSVPDMKGPIGFALSYPHGRLRAAMPRLDLEKLAQLRFLPLDGDKFPTVAWARECLTAGSGASAAFNAANEVAVAAFLSRCIPFTGITRIVGEALETFGGADYETFEEVTGLCQEVVKWANARCAAIGKIATQ